VKKSIQKTIEKLAHGYAVEEVTEEYGVEDGELKLVRRREVKKQVPPDLKAVKLLADAEDYTVFSDEELEAEKKRLLKKLKESGNEGDGRECGEQTESAG